MGSSTIPDEILKNTINGTGRWIARNHWSEKRLTFVLQYPNGMLIITIKSNTIIRFIENVNNYGEHSEKHKYKKSTQQRKIILP